MSDFHLINILSLFRCYRMSSRIVSWQRISCDKCWFQ